MNRTKKLVMTGLLIAVGVVLPMAFHSVLNAGAIFLPMHIPVMLCGFVAGPIFGLLCGVLTPVISSFSTGMPVAAILPGMICELATYGFVSGLIFRLVKSKKAVLNIYVALITAMLFGRCMAGFVNGVIFLSGKYTVTAWVAASFVTSLPGILIQLVLIPALIFALVKANLIELEDGDIWGLKDGRSVKKTKEYFDNLAERWDSMSKESPERLQYLISECGVEQGECVLDVACGTGLIDDVLINAGAADVTAVDVSDKMIEIAKSKNQNEHIRYYVEDFYEMLTRGFDRAIVFNAYPHFTDKRAFVCKLNDVLKKGGKFVIIHSAPPDIINHGHGRSVKARMFSKELKSAVDETRAFEKYFDIVKTVDDGDKYLIMGIKR